MSTTSSSDVQPLQQWQCDRCPDLITNPGMAMVVWQVDDLLGYKSFLIIHKGVCDPDDSEQYVHSLDLDHLLGPEGLTLLLSWLSVGPIINQPGSRRVADLDRYVDLVRRLHIPYYEEARSRFEEDETLRWLSDANEYYPYLPEVLHRIAEGTLGP